MVDFPRTAEQKGPREAATVLLLICEREINHVSSSPKD